MVKRDDAKQLVINFWGGPGSGKSTTSALLFGYLKQHGFNVELVTEYAKELVWEERTKTLTNQIYLLGKQTNRIEVLKGQVDAVITDSPIPLCSIYRGDHYPECFDELVKWQFNQHFNMNFFLKRVKDFNPKGRVHDLEQSKKLDMQIRDLMERMDISSEDFDGNADGVRQIQNLVHSRLLQRKVFS